MKETQNFKKLIELRLSVMKELFTALWEYKLWWAIPIIIIIFLVTALLLMAGYSGVGVFIYPLI